MNDKQTDDARNDEFCDGREEKWYYLTQYYTQVHLVMLRCAVLIY